MTTSTREAYGASGRMLATVTLLARAARAITFIAVCVCIGLLVAGIRNGWWVLAVTYR